jgi:hypothetical protein
MRYVVGKAEPGQNNYGVIGNGGGGGEREREREQKRVIERGDDMTHYLTTLCQPATSISHLHYYNILLN